ncbi:metal-binding protein [Halobacteriales archaeon QS_8_69_26]|nr:MAG: metal-binding protein [Halobacteriales archaeon QS_8_69_26]
MQCRSCGSDVERPGDYCLVCRSANADAVVLDLGRERAAVTAVEDGEVRGTTTVTTTPEAGEDRPRELRNYASRIADEARRKRPEEVYAAGDREVLSAVREWLHYDLYRVAPGDDEDPVETALRRRGSTPLEVVETPPGEKLGGSHSTLIAGRDGRRAVQTVAGHPHVKKVIPGPIDAGGTGSQNGARAKATRADDNGNVRLLIRDGSSVQENRVVTTARDRETGEAVRTDLNEALDEADLRG